MTSPSADQVDYEDEDDHMDAGEETDLEAPFATTSMPPAGLKEISSLASWTVSSSKSGCGVAALRSLDANQFWQSDGPQPHYLTVHFFKLVSIVHMRIYLDFENDESYTPTKMQFWAGMGIHDLQEFAEMTFEQPKGWIDVDFSKVGAVPEGLPERPDGDIDWSLRPVLRAFLVQVRIIENHQNGKDTHLRGLQIFSIDPASTQLPILSSDPVQPVTNGKPRQRKANGFKDSGWMMEAELR